MRPNLLQAPLIDLGQHVNGLVFRMIGRLALRILVQNLTDLIHLDVARVVDHQRISDR